jgi:MFS family permease
MADPAPHAAEGPPTTARERLVVATCCAGVAVIIGLTAGAIALLPDIGRDLGATQTELQWIGDSYPVLVAALLLPAGALLDRYGRRRGMTLGLVVLAAGLLVTAAGDTVTVVVAGRCLAGVGAALVFPGTLATMTAVLPAHHRRMAVALWAVSVIVGGVLGLLLCTVATELVGWEAAFLAFAVITGALVVLTVAVVPETRDEERRPIDVVGALTSVGGIGSITLAVTEGPVHGWGSPVPVVGLLVGVALLAAFVAWELRTAHPLLDVRLFADGRFGAASTALFVMFFAHFALFFLAFQYLGYVQGYSTLHSALVLIPPVVGFVLTPFSPYLAQRFGRRRVIVTGLLITASGGVAAVAMPALGSEGYWTFAIAATLIWGGMGMSMAAPTEMIIEAVPAAQQGVASAVNDLARELSAAFGIAIAGSAFNTAYRSSVGDAAGLPPGSREVVLDSPATALGSPATAGDDVVVAAVRDGVVAGWQLSFVLVTVVVLLGAAVVARRAPRADTEAAREAVPAAA